MSLSDRETLELNELCNAWVDGTLTGAQRTRLGSWLAESEDARQYYVRVLDLSASLAHQASEMQMEAADAPRRSTGWLRLTSWQLAGVAAAIVASTVIVW